MTYTILFLNEERVVKSTSWDDNLDAAKKYACDHIVAEKAHRAEVWDEADAIVFRYHDR